MKRLLVFALFAGCAGDCSDMKLRIVENDGDGSHDQRVGLGLTLFVDVYVQKSGFPVNPENLAVVEDVPDAVDIAIGAIPYDASGQVRPEGERGYTGKVVGLTPLAPGDNGFVFIADNTDETVGLSYEAMPVTEVAYLPRQTADDPIPNNRTWFKDTDLECFLEYRSDGIRVVGTTKVDVTASAGPGPTYVHNTYAVDETDPEFFYDLGDAPYTATFSTPAAPQTLTMHIVDTAGIASLRADINVASFEVEQGRNARFKVTPLDAVGQPILGRTYERATSQVTGTAVMVSAIFVDGEVAVAGVELGQSTISLTWGTAKLDVIVNVVAPPM